MIRSSKIKWMKNKQNSIFGYLQLKKFNLEQLNDKLDKFRKTFEKKLIDCK